MVKVLEDQHIVAQIASSRWNEGMYCTRCKKTTSHYPVSGRKSYICSKCAHHTYPLAGTIFEKSRTPLSVWMKARKLIEDSEGKVTVVYLKQELGVTYKTAWRMKKLIGDAVTEGGYVIGSRAKELTFPVHLLAYLCLMVSMQLVVTLTGIVR